jgi:signal transduction histidine kinase
MNPKNNFQELQALLEELNQLSKKTLPIPTRTAIETARKRLAQLERSLHEDLGEGRLGALYRVSRSLGNSLNLSDVLTQVMDSVIQLTGAERGFLTLINPDTGDLDLRAARNIEQETLQREDMEISRTVVQSVIESGDGVVTTDAQTDPRFSQQESVIFYALRSILCAPLRARGGIIGVIYVENRAQKSLFSQDDLDMLSAFAGQAAIAIENARLYTRTDRALNDRVAELETLSQVDLQLNENLDLNRVFEITRNWATNGTGGDEAWITSTDEDSNDQILVSGPLNGQIPIPDLRYLSNISRDPTPQVISKDGSEIPYLMAPLLHSRKVTGSIIVAVQEKSLSKAIPFLGRLAARSATAIENAKLYQAVQSANDSKSQFVSIVTHELRIPLTSIKGYTDLIRQGMVGPVNEKQNEFLDVIRNNVGRMTTLISDLSDISRIERGLLKLELGHASLEDTIEETTNSLRQKLDEKSQELIIDIPDNLPQVYTDPNRLVQILTNLVSNAWKYTPEGGSITIRAMHQDDQVKVEVIDDGIGISQEDQTKLFSQFFRSESPAVREQTGWGLGLNVTKRLVEVLSGDIGVVSKPGGGSRFWFTLPTTPLDSEA